MKLNRREMTFLTAATLVAGPALAEGEAAAEPKMIEVQMLNKHPETGQPMQFVPRIIHANVGDTIKFLATDKGHNAVSNKKMLPEGAEGFKGGMNKEVEYVVETPGFLGIECTPHRSVGMVGLIVAEGEGKLANLEDAMKVRHSGKAKKAWEEIWEEAEAAGLLEEVTPMEGAEESTAS